MGQHFASSSPGSPAEFLIARQLPRARGRAAPKGWRWNAATSSSRATSTRKAPGPAQSGAVAAWGVQDRGRGRTELSKIDIQGAAKMIRLMEQTTAKPPRSPRPAQNNLPDRVRRHWPTPDDSPSRVGRQSTGSLRRPRLLQIALRWVQLRFDHHSPMTDSSRGPGSRRPNTRLATPS